VDLNFHYLPSKPQVDPAGGFPDQVRAFLERGNHVRYRVIKRDLAFQIRLPIACEHLEIVFPAAPVKTFANGVRSVL
jgi:hypothetical protein